MAQGLARAQAAGSAGAAGEPDAGLSGELLPAKMAPAANSRVVPASITVSEPALNFSKVTLIMRINHHKLLNTYLITVDLLAMAFSFLIAASVVVSEVDGVPFTQFLSIRISILNSMIFIGFTFIWYITLALSGAYYVRRLSQNNKQIINIIQIPTFGTLILILLIFIFNI